MKEYLVILERGATSWGAYSPDALGCVAVGKTREEAYRLYQEALQSHLEWMREEGDTRPKRHSETAAVALALGDAPPKTFLAILEPDDTIWSASAADVPDLVARGATREEALRDLKTALTEHFLKLQNAGQPIPEPASEAVTLVVREEELAVAV